MPMPVSTWVEVDLDRFSHNLESVRRRIGSERNLLLVVKADAYGHGAVEVAAAAADEGVAALGVATLHEGIQLRRSGNRLPILVLSPLLEAEIGESLANDLEPSVGDEAFAQALSRMATDTRRPARFHVEVDTGMGRTGVRFDVAADFIARAVALPGLRLASVYTHFPDADGEDLAYSRSQLDRFREVLAELERRGIAPPRVHASNSAGTMNLEDGHFDWVRVGLVAYGHHPPRDSAHLDLQPVMAFKSRIVQLRDLPPGDTVSYARTWTSTRPSRIGVVAVGYGHGYSWLLSNRGHMLVRGHRVPIVGRVTMDLTMLDVTDLADVQVGDEVVLFGEQGDVRLPIEEVAAGSETLPYEIMCTIGKRVTRIFVRGGRPVKLTSLVGESEAWTHQAADHFRMRDEALAAARAARGEPS
ncbi:MAG: alanine racemase [Candidatus Eisenbacteria bacterium]|uniref:Alanine racemase n=1 Tax=Eiseniibacteriota bacterium TaxID=2212470 RepID=A0A849SS65_UNCEI|nr:alanine racemase [Candidatus Eisenbacteria bacterium]